MSSMRIWRWKAVEFATEGAVAAEVALGRFYLGGGFFVGYVGPDFLSGEGAMRRGKGD